MTHTCFWASELTIRHRLYSLDGCKAFIVQIFEQNWNEQAVESIVQEMNAYAAEKEVEFGESWKKLRKVKIRLLLARLIQIRSK